LVGAAIGAAAAVGALLGAAVGAVVAAGAALGDWPIVLAGPQAASVSASSTMALMYSYIRLLFMIETPDFLETLNTLWIGLSFVHLFSHL
jgi:hypothetical protein